MKKFNSGLLLAGVAAASIVLSAQASALADPLAPGALDGSYTDLADQVAAAADAVTGAEASLAGANEDLAAANAAVASLNSALSADDKAALAEYSALDALSTQKGALATLAEAVSDAQAAFDDADTGGTPDQLVALTAAQAEFAAAYEQYSADVLAFDSEADVATFNPGALQEALADDLISGGAATEIDVADATLADLFEAGGTRDGAVTAAAEVVDGAAEALGAAELVLAPLDRADGLLSAASASSQANIALASGALTGDDAAAGSNYETEVLGALVDHEGRITANTTAISKERDDRIAAGLAEQNARIAADTQIRTDFAKADAAIRADLNAEKDARIRADNELRDRIASSTATAIALGGAAILPDTNFTLSGNVGFYQGAQAVALNAAARIGAKAYVTGAFGGGLNKRGELGGRVGFVFGF